MPETKVARAARPVSDIVFPVGAALYTYLRALLFAPVYFYRAWLERWTILTAYYPNPQFRQVLHGYVWRYLFTNPYKACQQFFARYPGSTVQTIYGETFLTTLHHIAELAKIGKGDVVYELGCGRGLSVYWLAVFRGCKCVGVDLNPIFIQKAETIRKSTQITNVEFLRGDFFELDYSATSVLYLYGSALPDSAIKQLVEHFQHLTPGTLVITVSFPLSDYDQGRLFKTEHVTRGKFLWGETEIYFQRKC